jgi:hypothetical protein
MHIDSKVWSSYDHVRLCHSYSRCRSILEVLLIEVVANVYANIVMTTDRCHVIPVTII